MRIEIELSFYGVMNHFKRINEYDDMLGYNVKGFWFRVRPLFVRVVWAAR